MEEELFVYAELVEEDYIDLQYGMSVVLGIILEKGEEGGGGGGGGTRRDGGGGGGGGFG